LERTESLTNTRAVPPAKTPETQDSSKKQVTFKALSIGKKSKLKSGKKKENKVPVVAAGEVSAFSADTPKSTQRLQYRLKNNSESVTEYNIFTCPPTIVTKTQPVKKQETVSCIFMLSCLSGCFRCVYSMLTIASLLHVSTREESCQFYFFQSLSLYEMMTVEEPTQSFLELLLKRTRHYLKNFKNLLGPTAASLSKMDLKSVKFHAPLHIPRQIQRFGRSQSFLAHSWSMR
jgi:hypothetical protein